MSERLERPILRSAVLAACASLVACGSSVEPHARRKLADETELSGVLAHATGGEARVALLDEDWSAGAGAWTRFEDPNRAAAGDDAFSIETDAGGFATLTGRRGAVFRVLPVEPGATYRFQTRVRARDLVCADETFFGATPWIGELAAFHEPDELLRLGATDLITTRHLFPSSIDSEWHERERVFRTRPTTRALVVACVLTLDQTVVSGSVDYGRVRVESVPAAEHWAALIAEASKEFERGEPDAAGWRAERRVRALAGADLRPSIVLLPGERLTQGRIAVPSGAPVLDVGLAAWRPALEGAIESGASRSSAFSVAVDGEEVLRIALDAPTELVETRWDDHVVDLSAFAGDEVELTWGIDGDLPGVFGAPALRDDTFRSKRPNLVLVSIDTLRADRLGSYGYKDARTPKLDELAAESIRFEKVYSQAPYTLPSHTSMFSGQFPSVHGIQKGRQVISLERSPLLARILSDRGYRTLALTGGGFLNADFGFDQGFDGFSVIDPLRHADSRYLQKLVSEEPDLFSTELIEENGIERAKAFVADSRDEPFFLFLHTYTVHDYDPPLAFQRCAERGCTYERTDWRQFRLAPAGGWNPQVATDEDRAHLSHRYDDALTYVDHLLGGFFDRLAELGLDENTIVVVTTDHGEEMLERGFVQHGKTLYEEVTHIPLILHVPGEAPRVETAPAMTIDIVPTLLPLMGLPTDPRMQGVDLLRDVPSDRSTWSEIHDTFVHRYAMRDGGWKLIHSPHDDEIRLPSKVEWELYDLENDPHETRNLFEVEADRFERLRDALEQTRETLRALGEGLGSVGSGEIDPQTLSQLRELGYL